MLEQHASRRAQRHAARAAIEELDAELVLEETDLTTEGRLGDVQDGRRGPRGPHLGDSDEVAQLIEAHQRERIKEHARRVMQNGYWPAGASARHVRRMSIAILREHEVARMRRAGQVAAATLACVGARLKPGIRTSDIDRWVREDTAARGGAPSQLGYQGFPAAVCTSRNHVVCHGIPRDDERLEPGDIVNVDVTTRLDGYHGDTSATFFIGEPSPEARHVVEVARRARDAGIAVVRDGVRLGDVGAVIAALAESEGCSVVRDLGGHGIGRSMHQEPHVAHHGRPGSGRRLKAGMAITIEPMINLGGPAVRFLDDGWTVVTADGSLSAQFEHTIVVTKRGSEITTRALASG